MIDGMTYDPNVVDTVNQTPPPAYPAGHVSSTGRETAERIMRERIDRSSNEGTGMSAPEDGSKGLGKFHFEGK